MSASMMIMVALVGVLFLVVVALSYRLWKLRQVGGTAAILRDFPAVGGQGWRHGVMRYRGGEAGFYRLSSFRWWPDRTLSRRGLEIASRIGAASLQSYIYANLASAYCALTDRCETEGLQAASAAAALDRELGQLDHLAVPLVVMAQIHQCSGQLQKADEAYREALSLAEKIGEPQLILPCYDGLATIHLDRGDRVRAEEYMEKARQLCERTGLDPDTLLLLPFLC